MQLDYSNAREDVQDLKTFLQKTLDKLFSRKFYLFSPTENYTENVGKFYGSANRWAQYQWGGASPTISTSSEQYMKLKTGENASGSVFSEKLIDVTDFEKITLQYRHTHKGSYDYFGLTLSTDNNYNFATNKQINGSTAILSTLTLDVSGLTGKYYVCFSLSNSGSGTYSEIDISEIFME